MGCYGDRYAVTPNLDKLASDGLLYRHAWSNAPVCAPARTTIISGLYAPSAGAEHMRSYTSLPEGLQMFPCYLREAGYYTTNNAKEDYNLAHTGRVWDDSSNRAHWRNRAAGQPFFAVFNFQTTHESNVRRRPHTLVHDPARARIPAYHPDTPEVRHDWAQYYDNITAMDRQAGGVLKQLEDDGLLDSTIVFFYGDHGPGIARCKRFPYNSGLQVPLIVRIPEKFRHLAPKEYRPGGASEQLVSFVDLAPTILSLAGIKAPAHMQGRAFLGRYPAPEPEFLHGFRGRMDERYDMVRSVRDRRYVYLRNFMTHLPAGQHVSYMFETPTTQVWKRLFDEGKLTPAQRHFWEPKPPEELYDLQSDPDEVNNLAASPAHRATLERMRRAQRDHALRIRDAGYLPEAEIHARSQGSTPYQMSRDESRYPLRKIMEAAEAASLGKTDPKSFSDADSAVRHWAVMGALMRGAEGLKKDHARLVKALDDPSPSVRVAAAEALGRYGNEQDAALARQTLLELADVRKHGGYAAIAAWNAIDYLGPKAAPMKAALAALPAEDPNLPERARGYVARLIKTVLPYL